MFILCSMSRDALNSEPIDYSGDPALDVDH